MRGSSSLVLLLVLVTLTTRTAGAQSSSDHTTRLPVSEECPLYCFCPSRASVMCADSGLSIVPIVSSSVIQEYFLTGNNLTRLPKEVFEHLRQLRLLDVSRSNVHELDDATFAGLRNLRELRLANNRVQQSSWAVVLEPLTQLAILNLSGNAIRTIEGKAFEPLHQLHTLDLSSNVITGVDFSAFQGLDSLQTLDLSNNFLRRLHGGMFFNGPGLSLLATVDLSYNKVSAIDPEAFLGAHQLEDVNLHGNEITSLPVGVMSHMPALRRLHLGANPIVFVNRSQFLHAQSLQEIFLDHMPSLVAVLDDAFASLPVLHLVRLSHNGRLRHVSPVAFRNCNSLAELDVSHGALETLHGSLLVSLPNLKSLGLAHNPWYCDCALQWITTAISHRPTLQLPHISEATCAQPPSRDGDGIVTTTAATSKDGNNCSEATVLHHSAHVRFRLGSTALLECQATGNPWPALQWTTPSQDVYTWFPPLSPFAVNVRPVEEELGSGTSLSRVQVLRNGNLFISAVHSIDAGLYVCLADNVLGHQAVQMALTLDFEVLMHVKLVSILVGLATSIAFMLVMLVAQLIHMLLNRWGWCCCGTLSPKARHIRKMLESVEHYKGQQLEWLRENYAMQVQRIKDNCQQQMERLRDSYTLQTDRFRDIRDYGTQQLNCMRDQYYEQVHRVRDYSVLQLNRVRENYVLQRNRVRKFSAHQLFKLRENYKVQQMHLNKILENLNLESCRTVCARTDSIMFTSETMEGAFESITTTSDGKVSLPCCDDHILQRLGMTDLMAIDAFPIQEEEEEDDDDDSLNTAAFVTPLQSPVGSPFDGGGDAVELRNMTYVDLDQVVTCIVVPGEASDNRQDPSVVNV